MRLNSVLIFLSSLLLLVGCAKTDSSDVATSSIFTTYTVDGSGSVKAQFNVGNALGTFLELSAGDSIAVNGTVLTQTTLGNIVQYTGTVSVSPGDTVTFVFTRTGEDPYSSSVTVPTAISTTAPTAASSHTAGAVIATSWTAGTSGDNMVVFLDKNGSGETDQTNTVDDSTGTASFAANETTKVTTGTISATVNFTRQRTGTIASGHDGTITASQTAEVSISLTD